MKHTLIKRATNISPLCNYIRDSRDSQIDGFKGPNDRKNCLDAQLCNMPQGRRACSHFQSAHSTMKEKKSRKHVYLLDKMLNCFLFKLKGK